MKKRNLFRFLLLSLAIIIIIGLTTAYVLSKSQNVTPNQQSHQISPTGQVISSKVNDQAEQQQPQDNQLAADNFAENLPGVKVTRVIDGDTIEIEGGQRVRYIGINTPETVDPRTPVQCFGKEASIKNRQLVEGKTVKLEKDISETDKYGRLLRYIYVDGIFVNDYLIRQGFAYASTYPPDVKYQNQFTQALQEAQSQNRGIWAACQSRSQPSEQSQNQQGCIIKGNISSSGEKIYHMPGQKYYDKTVIDESRGERFFCTEDEAIAAGWRKSKT